MSTIKRVIVELDDGQSISVDGAHLVGAAIEDWAAPDLLIHRDLLVLRMAYPEEMKKPAAPDDATG